MDTKFIESLKFDENGLIPCITQDANTKDVLMLAYMSKESIVKTIETNLVTYYSRSRSELWQKGATSGHFQHLKSLSYDCDGDTILVKAIQDGVACHTGAKSCFFNSVIDDQCAGDIIDKLYEVLTDRKENPKEGSYTTYLFNEGVDKILKKVGEEAAEVIIGAKNSSIDEVIYETSDLVYHMLVLLTDMGISPVDIKNELCKRHGK